MKLINIITNRIFSLLCFVIGVIWFLSLSQFEFNHKTYMSENALLVGLIKQHFNNHSALNHFYKELTSLHKQSDSDKTKLWLKDTMSTFGLDTEIQNFTFKYNKLLNHQQFDGQNVYGILRSPGAARMQAILVTAPLRYGGDDSPDNQPLLSSLSIMLALAQHARGKLYWATDIIFLFTEMDYVGLKAWLNAYHGLNDVNQYIVHQPLTSRSGSILAGLNMEIASSKIPYVEFRVESLNGQLPNLDLYNSLVRLAQSASIPVKIHGVTPPVSTSITARKNGLKILLSMMWYQSSGSPNGLHGLLADFQVPSVTIYAPSNDRLTPRTNLFDVTKLLESTLRSLNGLQERMHQSFFFYLLPSPMAYISIGMYMIPFGLMCGCGLLCQVIGALHYFQLRLKELDKIHQEEDIFDWWSVGFVIVLSLSMGFFSNFCLDHILIHSHKFQIEPNNALLFSATVLSVAMLFMCRLRFKKTTFDTVTLLRATLQLGLALFLGTLSILNISMAFFFALVSIPAALFVYPYRNCFARLLCKLHVIIICPIALLYLSALVHNSQLSRPSFRWTDMRLYKESFTLTRHWLIQGWTEKDILGSWTTNIFVLCYFPLWIVMWCICRMKAVDSKTKN